METLARLVLLTLLAGCGGSAPDPETTAPLPIAEPLRMRDVIGRELDGQRAAAREREALFDQAVSPR